MDNIARGQLIIDNRAEGVFRVHRRAFTDPHLLELEKCRVFDQSWLYAGHASEIPQPGDFRARRVAGRPVILVRGGDGTIRILLNTCTHRGALVCREQTGNAKTFQCFYHAWTYNNQGDLIGVPGDEAYSAAFDRRQLGLAMPPRVESYRGFLFVSFNPRSQPWSITLQAQKPISISSVISLPRAWKSSVARRRIACVPIGNSW